MGLPNSGPRSAMPSRKSCVALSPPYPVPKTSARFWKSVPGASACRAAASAMRSSRGRRLARGSFGLREASDAERVSDARGDQAHAKDGDAHGVARLKTKVALFPKTKGVGQRNLERSRDATWRDMVDLNGRVRLDESRRRRCKASAKSEDAKDGLHCTSRSQGVAGGTLRGANERPAGRERAVRASPSARSLAGVAVPWALM